MQKTALTPSTVVRQARSIVSSAIHDETALLSIENGRYYGMDQVASRIWELIVEPVTVEAVVEQLMTKFEVDRSTCESHVTQFLGGLVASGLVQVEDGSAA